MTKRMLIDATHEEETRVAVLEDNRLVDFDYESQFRKPLKGSIFFAKVTRVEPSLQAAFVNFGGNRHGFLPFSEIHPDYFRIPIADREALIAEQEAAMAEAEAAEEAEEEAEAKAEEEKKKSKGSKKTSKKTEEEDQQSSNENIEDEADSEEDDAVDGNKIEDEDADDVDGNKADDAEDAEEAGNKNKGRNNRGRGRGRGRNHRSRGAQKRDDNPERRFRYNLRRKYKIQEVIKRGQIMLIQVSKEERGNKGAAVGSYLSLPGRYCVLMPNSPRAGGVSRKIASYKDRNRMREIMKDLEVPKGMSVILRTAGVQRTKTEIKRDLDYLIKLWNNIRELTLESSAPAMVYEEADLIKRAVRDLYTRDVEDIIVSGEAGYKNARNFMKMMIPSHAKRVKEYKDEAIPLFNKYKVESQIAEIGEIQVTLPSGGYLIINPTEALVSIDVNSGKSTKERHIEETALRTNLEAAQEVARQLRLRDLGGLVVIDFIDMEDRRNNGKVERKMRDALSSDRARVQVGRISSFGLMELSRQRLSPSLTEAQFESCAHCEGTGRIRTADATTIMVLRALEDEGIKKRAAQLIVHVSAAVAVYILNNKRKQISSLEERYGFQVVMRADDTVGPSGFRVEVSKPLGQSSKNDSDDNNDDNSDEDNKSSKGRRRGRRGGRRRGRRDNDQDNNHDQDTEENKHSDDQDKKSPSDQDDQKEASEDKQDEKPKRGRGKRSTKKEEDKKKTETEEKSQEDNKKSSKKTASKPKEDKNDDKKEVAKKKTTPRKTSKASNDDKSEKKDDASKDYETVNKAPEKKKKGWWSR